MTPAYIRAMNQRGPITIKEAKRRAWLAGQQAREQETLISKLPMTLDQLTTQDRLLLNELILEKGTELQTLLQLHMKMRGVDFNPQQSRTMTEMTTQLLDVARAEYEESMRLQRLSVTHSPGEAVCCCPLCKEPTLRPEPATQATDGSPDRSTFQRVLDWFKF